MCQNDKGVGRARKGMSDEDSKAMAGGGSNGNGGKGN